MRKNFLKLLMAVVAVLFGADMAHAADPAVKQEFRSTWLATVWRLDWPNTVISQTGNATQIANQKRELTVLLDSLKINNFNAINLQIRSRSDAMYKSSYEPWSVDLVDKRGLDPGWDPLAFAVEECHKRGMECHAWINPYRYESVTGAWGKEDVYRKEHPEWILDINGASILNPGLPEVTQRICDIVKEIVTNYDIDGMLFDDYFYLSGVTESHDGELFEQYKENGGTLNSIKDWRRANVNDMVKRVYQTIQETKPWVRFGVGPAGIACTDGSVARKYGITACPTGRDWQYDDIFSDPIAWYAEQSVDYMAPQIYWTIENSSPNYLIATRWWSGVAAKFNRQMFVSHDIASINSLSEATPFGMSHTEAALMRNRTAPKATGPHNTNFVEFSNEVKVNRQESLDGAPGSVFYSAKYLYSKAFGKGLLANHLRSEVFTTPALVPPMTHKRSNNPGLVTEISKNGNTLVWKGFDNMRYSVYAVPESEKNFTRQAEYLLGVTYTTSFEIPASKTAGHKLAVCAYDRLGYEYSAAFMGEAIKNLDAPTLLTPAEGAEVEAPVTFSWTEVTDAILYNIDIATDPQFSDLICTVTTESSTITSAEMSGMPMGQKLYWRVRASGNNANDGISAVRSFTPDRARFTYPVHQQIDVEICPEFTWTPEEHNISMELATTPEFERIFYTAELQGGKHKLPFSLAAGTEYHARFHYVKDGESLTSPVISFTTQLIEATTPEVISPIDGGSFYGDDTIKLKNVEGSNQVIYYVATSASGLSRGSSYKGEVGSSESCPIAEIPTSKTFFKDGNKYYFKVSATFQTVNGVEKRETPAFSATYLGASGVESVAGDADVAIEGNKILLGGKAAQVNIYSVDGRLIKSVATTGEEVDLEGLESGIYLIKVSADNTTTTLKHQIL